MSEDTDTKQNDELPEVQWALRVTSVTIDFEAELQKRNLDPHKVWHRGDLIRPVASKRYDSHGFEFQTVRKETWDVEDVADDLVANPAVLTAAEMVKSFSSVEIKSQIVCRVLSFGLVPGVLIRNNIIIFANSLNADIDVDILNYR